MNLPPGSDTPGQVSEDIPAGMRLATVNCPQCGDPVPVESAHVNTDRLWVLAGELPALSDLGVIGVVAAVAMDRARRACPGHETVRVDGEDIPEDIAALCAEFADLLAGPVLFNRAEPDWTPEQIKTFEAELERKMASDRPHWIPGLEGALTAGPVTHIAGAQIQVGNRLRQRCSWCGAVLCDYDLERIAVPEGQDPRPAMRGPGCLVRVDGIVSFVVEHEDGAELPEDACTRAGDLHRGPALMGAESAPAEVAGRITIEWPNAADRETDAPVTGSQVVIRDAYTGEPLRTLGVTVTIPGLRLTASSMTGAGPVFADVTHPAGDGGRVLDRDYGPDGYWDPGAGRTAVRRYEVTRMSEVPAVDPWTAKVTRAGLTGFFSRVHEDGGTVEALKLTADDMRELVYGPRPYRHWPGVGMYTENGVTLPERVASVRVTIVRNTAAGGAEIPVSLAPEGEEASALVRYRPDTSQVVPVVVEHEDGAELPADSCTRIDGRDGGN